MKASLWICGLSVTVWLSSGFMGGHERLAASSPAIRYAAEAAQAFAASTQSLTDTCQKLDSSAVARLRAKSALAYCRICYKRFSFLLDGCFPAQAKLYNGPAKFEVEEPFQEFEPPQGLQQLEALLYRPYSLQNKDSLLEELTVIRESASTLPALFATATISDDQLFSFIQVEIVRIVCLYLAGYDAPLLRSGIDESRAAMEGMQALLLQTKGIGVPANENLLRQVTQSVNYLRKHRDFLLFNRLVFIRQYGLPLDQAAIRISKKNRDSSDFLSDFIYHRSGVHHAQELRLIELGKRLFHDVRLSGNQLRSCATCHVPDKYFTDGLIHNQSLDQLPLPRNTPTLLYAALQSSQFWDGRAATLVAQLHSVLSSPAEMNAIDTVVLARLNRDKLLQRAFAAAFHPAKEIPISMREVGEAVIHYLQTLAPASSRFDRYLRGEAKVLSHEEQAGFNLFMGKAQCGTCHFFPVFNGSTPPAFARSEFEVLGVPANADFAHPVTDTDSGRFGFFMSPLYYGAFKTPTVRNSARTSPYMHNGALPTLKSVVSFYNTGGGLGLGLAIPNQTLASDSLRLSSSEQQVLVRFLSSLTDELPTRTTRARVRG